MSRLNRTGWILIGVVIGALASTALTAASARQERTSRRLSVLSAGPLQTYNTSFIKDTKTGACWFAIRSRDDVGAALAPAPAASCEP